MKKDQYNLCMQCRLYIKQQVSRHFCLNANCCLYGCFEEGCNRNDAIEFCLNVVDAALEKKRKKDSECEI